MLLPHGYHPLLFWTTEGSYNIMTKPPYAYKELLLSYRHLQKSLPLGLVVIAQSSSQKL